MLKAILLVLTSCNLSYNGVAQVVCAESADNQGRKLRICIQHDAIKLCLLNDGTRLLKYYNSIRVENGKIPMVSIQVRSNRGVIREFPHKLREFSHSNLVVFPATMAVLKPQASMQATGLVSAFLRWHDPVEKPVEMRVTGEVFTNDTFTSSIKVKTGWFTYTGVIHEAETIVR